MSLSDLLPAKPTSVRNDLTAVFEIPCESSTTPWLVHVKPGAETARVLNVGRRYSGEVDAAGLSALLGGA